MVQGKKEHDVDLLIMQTGFIGEMLVGTFKPLTANPYRSTLPQLTEAQRRDGNDTGMRLIGKALKEVARANRAKRRNKGNS